jgi:hypothetical protein
MTIDTSSTTAPWQKRHALHPDAKQINTDQAPRNPEKKIAYKLRCPMRRPNNQPKSGQQFVYIRTACDGHHVIANCRRITA